MPDASSRAALVTLLAWYVETGIDAVVGEEPLDWLARGQSPPGAEFAWPASDADKPSGSAGLIPPAARAPSRSATAPPAPRPSPVLQRAPAAAPSNDSARTPPARFASAPPDAAETEARRLAASANDLAGLTAALGRFEGCALKATAKTTCVFRGAERARLMIIGEAPGRDEDLEGRPFVGRAGQLLDRMLAGIDLDETDVHITNVVYWRPPGNRTPTPQETQVCRPFLERQIALVEPDVLLLLGGAATKAMLDTPDGIMKLRGKWRDIEIGGRRLRALATLHPAYLLRSPPAKRHAWRDLLALKTVLSRPTEI